MNVPQKRYDDNFKYIEKHPFRNFLLRIRYREVLLYINEIDNERQAP
jgi:hypothetical protein